MRIAIVGAGVSGISAAWFLKDKTDLVLFEKDSRLGGHAHPYQIDESTYVDTGFIVFNEKNYPGLCSFFDELGVGSFETTMSFGFEDKRTGFCYAGTGLNGLFCQRKHFFSPKFIGLLLEIRRVSNLLKNTTETCSLEEFFKSHNASLDVIRDYFLPLAAAIWSAKPNVILNFPVKTFSTFLNNHGLLSFGERPKWRTVSGSSRTYIKKFEERFGGEVRLEQAVNEIERCDNGVKINGELFDGAVVATHADLSLQLIKNPTNLDQKLLSPWTYQKNLAVLHTDRSLLPKNKLAWACWNFSRNKLSDYDQPVFVNYYMNMLQDLKTPEHYIVSLNPQLKIREETILRTVEYTHPQYTTAVSESLETFKTCCGEDRLYLAGAYTGYGFHEDGFQSGVRAGEQLLKDISS